MPVDAGVDDIRLKVDVPEEHLEAAFKQISLIADRLIYQSTRHTAAPPQTYVTFTRLLHPRRRTGEDNTVEVNAGVFSLI